MTDTPTKPVPPIDPWTQPYWDAAAEGRFVIQRCRACERAVFYPRQWCPHCGAEDLDWIEASGRGHIYSYSVVRNYPPSAFADAVPFVIAIVELEEGPRMMTNIVDADPEQVACDLPVEVAFMDRDGVSLPVFRLREVAPAGHGEA